MPHSVCFHGFIEESIRWPHQLVLKNIQHFLIMGLYKKPEVYADKSEKMNDFKQIIGAREFLYDCNILQEAVLNFTFLKIICTISYIKIIAKLKENKYKNKSKRP